MSVLNTRMLSTLIARNLDRTYSRLGVSTDRMSSGLRINNAADDTANITVRELMRADVSVLNQGLRNANDAVSLVQTADGALQVVDEKLIRMKELAEQASSGTYSSTQRLIIDSEFQAMAAEINRIANATDFNGIKLLDGSLTGLPTSIGEAATGELKLHYGVGNKASEDYSYLEIPSTTTQGLGLNDRTPRPLLSDGLTSGGPLQGFGGEQSLGVISKGSGNIRIQIDSLGGNANVQIFTTSGKHVAGTLPPAPGAYDALFTPDNGFNSNAAYDSATLNGIGGDLAYQNSTTPMPAPPTGLNNFTYNGMQIGYSGNGNPANSNEWLSIDGATEDLVIIVTGGHGFQARAAWDGDIPPAEARDSTLSIDTQEKAAKAIDQITDAIKTKDSIRAGLGAAQNRMEKIIDHNTAVSEEYMMSESELSDIDVAAEMTRFSSTQIGAQIATAMLAQANTLPQRALELLR